MPILASGDWNQLYGRYAIRFQADPIAVLRRVYVAFGVPFDDARETAIRLWMRQDQEGHAKGPRHSYRLDDYGLDYAAIDRVMGDYMRTFGVQLER